jgi:hypothetical protein
VECHAAHDGVEGTVGDGHVVDAGAQWRRIHAVAELLAEAVEHPLRGATPVTLRLPKRAIVSSVTKPEVAVDGGGRASDDLVKARGEDRVAEYALEDILAGHVPGQSFEEVVVAARAEACSSESLAQKLHDGRFGADSTAVDTAQKARLSSGFDSMPPAGIEPATPGLGNLCSIH